MRWFTTAIQITQTTGGSLADVLDTLANSLQEQQTLREKVAALTAQGKASGILLSLLPFLMMAALYLVAPDMTAPLFHTPIGQSIIAGVLVSVAIGGAIIKKIVTVKVD
jgi:tight adherence protein B